MLDLATQTVLDSPAARMTPGSGRRDAPPLPVSPALVSLLPGGLRRGSTVSVTGSVSLLLALLGAASAEGAWCALVGVAAVSAESATEYGIELSRLAVVPHPGNGWSTAVGALLDAVDVVATRPPAHVAPGDVRRLAARARTRDTVLVPFLTGEAAWPGADLRLRAHEGRWSGIGEGYGRLRRRQVTVTADGRGQAARPRSTQLWLPAATGGIDSTETVASMPSVPAVVSVASVPAAASMASMPTVGGGAAPEDASVLAGAAALRAG
jgi:hypothetical protein